MVWLNVLSGSFVNEVDDVNITMSNFAILNMKCDYHASPCLTELDAWYSLPYRVVRCENPALDSKLISEISKRVATWYVCWIGWIVINISVLFGDCLCIFLLMCCGWVGAHFLWERHLRLQNYYFILILNILEEVMDGTHVLLHP